MEYLIVPYKGSAPAYQDLVGGSIDAFIDPILGSSAFAKAGQLKVLAVTSKNRVPSQPEMPTVAETVPGYEFYSWYGCGVRPACPRRSPRGSTPRSTRRWHRHAREARAARPAADARLDRRLRALPEGRHGAVATHHHRGKIRAE
jgi:hypothetical protein